MSKLGRCEFEEGELVNYIPRGGTNDIMEEPYRVTEILSNEDGTFEDRRHIENYWIVGIITNQKYLVYPTELVKR